MKHEHGGNIHEYSGVLDFSANINPLGMPQSVRQAVIASSKLWESYPDPLCTGLVGELSRSEGVAAENIVCGNGAADLIFRLVHTLRPKRAAVLAPTFSEYAKALAEVGCKITEHFLSEEKGFSPDDRLLDMPKGTDMVFVCSPNNPTGQLIDPGLLSRLADRCGRLGVTLVCDECFIGFAENGTEHSLKSFMNDCCIVLNAFTKLYAMPGLRLGYALCASAELADKLRRSGQFWSVSAPAQAAGVAALGEQGYEERTAAYIASERAFLAKGLADAGIKVYPSDANFLLLRGKKELADRLLSEGILIRSCDNFSGLGEGYFRTAVRTREENERLISAVRRASNG